LNPNERIKKDDNPLNVRARIENIYAHAGFAAIDPNARPRIHPMSQDLLEPGMVFTIEPGLYFQPDDLTVPEEYRGIGVRIEDNILVTESGAENLSIGIPRTADDVEACVAAVRLAMAYRERWGRDVVIDVIGKKKKLKLKKKGVK